MTREMLIKKSNIRTRKAKNFLMISFCILSSIITIIPLIYIFFYTTFAGISSLNLNFIIEMPKPVGEEGGGIANAIVGTLILIAIGSSFGIPVGVLSGIYLSEFSKTRFSLLVRFVTDVLSGTPSIIIGIFIYGLIVIPMQRFSAIAGGVALGILMIPIISRTTEEMLKLIPITIREASLALGITRWKTTVFIVLKAALPGIINGILLAIARIAGETAPLLFTSFGNNFWSTKLDEPISSIAVQIFNYAISPYEDWHRKAWTGALILITLVFIISLIVKFVTKGKYSLK